MSDDLTVDGLVQQSFQNSWDHGFWDDPETAETIPSKLALIMSEAGEALESYRDPKSDDMVPVPADVLAKLIDWAGYSNVDDSERWKACATAKEALDKWNAKPKGFDIELADIVIRVADLSGKLGIDLAAAVQRKHEYNKSRPHKHGRIV